MKEEIRDEDGELIALLVGADFGEYGVNFLSRDHDPLQFAVSLYHTGARILPHVHLPKQVSIRDVQEVVHIDRGRMRVDFYAADGTSIASRELSTGDTVYFVSGGHGLDVLEDTKIIEVKQGPYLGKEQDKRVIDTE